jgi:hypothetical protein
MGESGHRARVIGVVPGEAWHYFPNGLNTAFVGYSVELDDRLRMLKLLRDAGNQLKVLRCYEELQ